ncbi:bifunctional Ribosomal protein L7-L30/Ribosomal protein L30 [Babesia duncani]|uniref:Bifunctional Ribosomal protein L7-L30/Ribosomal protein L30 n=1 Tax=Babesia duncani TaxID=323732 RepID=A0AAD9PIT2_9APIC|nr:bifunctional Ribosomal protein L7-L30/Ribosomal protein L30 [Babesia duncani]
MEGLNGELKKRETILSKHKFDLKQRAQIANHVRLYKSQRKHRRHRDAIVSLCTVFKRSKQQLLDTRRLKSQEKNPKEHYNTEHGLLLLVRNNRSVETDQSKNVLKTLGLYKKGIGRLLSNSKENMHLIDQILPFVYYGTPSLKITKLLLAKRYVDLHVKDSSATILTSDGNNTLISGNGIIEEHFGKLGIICQSDLVDAILNDSEKCKEVLDLLGPMDISSDIIRNDKFNYGDLGDEINLLVSL